MPSAIAKVADAPSKAPVVAWDLVESGYVQDLNAECLRLALSRTKLPVRPFPNRCRQLLEQARQQWRVESPEWSKAETLKKSLADTEAQLERATAEHDSASAALRAALDGAQDPSSAEVRLAAAGNQLTVLKSRVAILRESTPKARTAAENAWASAYPALLRTIRQTLESELRAAREKLLALLAQDAIGALADATAEAQIAGDGQTQQAFAMPYGKP